MKDKIDYKEITKLIDIIEERNLSHLELEIEGFKIKISREQPQPSLSPPPVSPPESKAESSSPSPAQEGTNNFHYITAPMVGTFYRAPDPSSPPFVDIGDEIKPNQTLCIIEAMKLMNEIESDTKGTIQDVYVENGKPVEYGQKLFAIKPQD
ncbi:acetyl-CoA carboxylase biotin carboxyl carrier protein [bacterium]|nr:acetyl-CoA carboxylase biotin carboxyl carrier protein [bacterium]